MKALLNLAGDRLHALPLVVMYLTDGCNSRCISCDIWRSPRRNMDMALVESIAAECGRLGVRWVLLSGGEAMQHPQWPEIGRRFRAAGVHVMLLTNGLLLRKQADSLPASVDEVIVSLDGGTAPTYHTIRGVDAFDLVLDGIRAVKERGLPVTTRTTVQKANFREIPQIIAAASDAGADQISFLAVDVANPFAFGPRDLTMPSNGGRAFARPYDDVGTPNRASGGEVPLTLNPDDIAELDAIIDRLPDGPVAESPAKLRRILVDYFKAVAGIGAYPAPRCNAPHFSTVIEVDGRLRPCYFLPEYGQVRAGDDLREAINNDAARDLRRAYRMGQRAECARCVCPLYKGPRALLRM